MATRKRSPRPTRTAKKAKTATKRPVAAKKKAAAAKKKTAGPAPIALKKLPIVWRHETGSQAVGLWVDDDAVWAANDRGEIFQLDKEGAVLRSYKLPKPVHCLLADDAWKFAGCSNGKVYDLTGRVPRALYEIDGGKQLDWLEMYRGTLCVSDDEGGLTVIDADGDVLWQKRDKKAREGWMCRADASGVWHGSLAGLRKYSWKGKLEWTVDDLDDFRFGWPQDDELIVLTGYGDTGKTTIRAVSKKGKARVSWTVTSSSRSFQPNGAESCGASRGGDGKLRLYAGVGGCLFCVDGDTGAPLWEASTGIGSPCTMQGDGDRLYVVTHKGSIACVDVSAAAVAAAAKGKVPRARVNKAGKVSAADVDVEKTRDRSKGVVVECVKDGGKLRVRVVSHGYNAAWFVQFPRDLRAEGAQFVVDSVREATQGGFYRVLGDIKRLE